MQVPDSKKRLTLQALGLPSADPWANLDDGRAPGETSEIAGRVRAQHHLSNTDGKSAEAVRPIGPFVSAAIAATQSLCAEWLDLYEPIELDFNFVHTATRKGYDVGDPKGHGLYSKFVAIAELLEDEAEHAS